MGDERPSDALQPGAKKRAVQGGRDRDEPDDDAPSVDPGTWTADTSVARERRKVHVRRGAGGPAAAPPAPGAPSNPFSGLAFSFGAAPAAAPAQEPAAETAGASAAVTGSEPSAGDKATEATAGEGQKDGAAAAEAEKVASDAKEAQADKPKEGGEGDAKAQDGEKAAASASPSGATAATTAATSIFGGSAGTTSGFASLAAGGASSGGSFNFGGFGGGSSAAAGSTTGGLFGSGNSGGGGLFGGSSLGTGGGLFGATGGFGGGFSFPKLDNSGGSLGKPLFGATGAGEEGGEGAADERPETFEPTEDPSIKPVVQLAVVQKVTGEENEQMIYAEPGKLYEYDSAASKWRERGSGELRVNVSADGSTSRVVMRQSGNLRLLLNARVTSSMPVQRMQGANGVTFGCVNTAAAVDPSQSSAAEAKDKADEAGKAATGLVRTWAFRTKGEDKVLALMAALEKAKQEHSKHQEEKKDAAAEV